VLDGGTIIRHHYGCCEQETTKGASGNIRTAKVFHGRVINIRDVVTFESDTVKGLLKKFHTSVDEHLALCKRRDEAPEKPFSGRCNMRLDPDLHRCVATTAASGKSWNGFIADTLRSAVPHR
jgi:predicted HicB family RNase H-like nuclease